MQKIYHQFQENLNFLNDFQSQKFLLAVSGGIDSMILCNLFLHFQLNFSVVHCNFQLRKTDSDLDESFVESYCNENKIEFFTQKFDVKTFKSTGNFSTQMAARELRYHWFYELKHEFQFDFIVTAHHLNDSLETFLINLSRGTGLQGLQGIQLQNESLFRPLYNISKKDLIQFAEEREITWREDISNKSDDYLRNKIRHHIIPEFESINSSFLQNYFQTIQNLQENNLLIKSHLDKIKTQLFVESKNEIHISIENLNQLNPLKTYLFHLFQAYNFHFPNEIIKLMSAQSSAEIQSKTHRLIKNRNELILIKIEENQNSEEFILEEGELMKNPLNLKFSITDERDLAAKETLNFNQIKFPIKLRKPKIGDGFYPLGMNGFKKISKFCKDLKLSKTEKENLWLLVDDSDQILYVIGFRIDERFKLNENTHKFLNIFLC